MWTTISTRARTALTVFATLLTMVLLVAAILLATQWAWPAQTHTYQSYSLEVTPAAPWHPGQSLSLVWIPSEEQTGPDAPPTQVTCQFWLFGPYATRAGAPTDQGAPMMSGATLATSATPLNLSTRVGAPAPGPVTYVLPATLAPGYYTVEASVQQGDTGGSSDTAWVAEVTA